MKVSVVNYGIGNLLSVERALKHCGADVSFVDTADQIMSSDRLLVPGVGAFQMCMAELERRGLKEALIEYAAKEKPYLGICVGMQMLMDMSFEFGEYAGLGLIPGCVKKIEIQGQKVPFVGWKEVVVSNQSSHFYFVHSYQAIADDRNHVQATYKLGGHDITAIVQKNNVVGVQFHPEKSAEDGLRYIADFLKL